MSEEDTPSPFDSTAPNNNNQPTAAVDGRPRPNEPIAVYLTTSND